MQTLLILFPTDIVRKIVDEYCDIDTRRMLNLPPRKLQKSLIMRINSLFSNTFKNTLIICGNDTIVSRLSLSKDKTVIHHYHYLFSKADQIINVRFSSWNVSEIHKEQYEKNLFIPLTTASNVCLNTDDRSSTYNDYKLPIIKDNNRRRYYRPKTTSVEIPSKVCLSAIPRDNIL